MFFLKMFMSLKISWSISKPSVSSKSVSENSKIFGVFLSCVCIFFIAEFCHLFFILKHVAYHKNMVIISWFSIFDFLWIILHLLGSLVVFNQPFMIFLDFLSPSSYNILVVSSVFSIGKYLIWQSLLHKYDLLDLSAKFTHIVGFPFNKFQCTSLSPFH